MKQKARNKEMIIIFKLIGAVATITALITYAGLKFVEWWEFRK
jgi:hypothetical protein